MDDPTRDKAAESAGPGFVCLDSMVLIHFNRVGRLDRLGRWFGPRVFTAQVVTELELRGSVGQHPENLAILAADWLEPVAVNDIEDIRLVAQLRQRWGSTGDKDRGEADIIALCRRYGWTAITDDEVGRRAATEYSVSRVYMLTAIIAAASNGLVSPSDAWTLHCSIERERRRAVLSPDDVHKPVFMACVEQFKRVSEKQGNPNWPKILAIRGLDDLVVRTRNNT